MDEFEATPAGGQLTRRAWLAAAASATATVTLSARAATTASPSPSRVRVAQGWLRGQSAGGVHRFLGIPFAQPPVGKLRWQPPRMPLAWQGTRDATQFGSCCEQAVSTLTELPIDRSRFAEEQLEQLRMRWGVISDMRASRSEDCLYLNVWTRTLDAGARQPVMVWIHGGGNLRGAGSEAAYDGAAFASKGVTLVTINYRLGAFGFLAHPNLGANFGLLDQIAALNRLAGTPATSPSSVSRPVPQTFAACWPAPRPKDSSTRWRLRALVSSRRRIVATGRSSAARMPPMR